MKHVVEFSSEPCFNDVVAAVPKARCELSLAKQMLRQIQRRSEAFDRSIDEVSWEMMLEAYVSEEQGRRNTMSGLCYCSRAPHATAARHLALMIEQGWVVRQPDPTDRRRHYVVLSSDARGRIARYLQACSGHPVPVGEDGKYASCDRI